MGGFRTFRFCAAHKFLLPLVHKSRLTQGNQAAENKRLFLCRSYRHNRGMKYGYARVSTDGQSVAAQVRLLTQAGCKKVFREVASGARPTAASYGASRVWLRAILQGDATLLLSVSLALQYEAVLTRPEHLSAGRASVGQIVALLDALCAVCRPIEISYLWRPTLRDPDDEMVREVAVNGRADRLPTFNEQDFAGAEWFGVQVVRPGPARRAWRQG
jgi:predicted nucleic acid-binding protein